MLAAAGSSNWRILARFFSTVPVRRTATLDAQLCNVSMLINYTEGLNRRSNPVSERPAKGQGTFRHYSPGPVPGHDATGHRWLLPRNQLDRPRRTGPLPAPLELLIGQHPEQDHRSHNREVERARDAQDVN